MEKKIYKTPVSRVVEFGTDDILQCWQQCSGDWGATVGVQSNDNLGDCYNPDDVSYSKGGSWEMEW